MSLDGSKEGDKVGEWRQLTTPPIARTRFCIPLSVTPTQVAYWLLS